MYMRIIKALFMLILLAGCSSNNSQNFTKQPNSVKNTTIIKIELDTLLLDSIETSFEIESSINDNKIYLVDKYMNYLYEYNTEGNLIKRYLGNGRARNETTIGRISSHTFLDDGIFFFNPNADYYFYDNDFIFKDMFNISYQNPEWNLHNIYEDPLAYSQRYSDIVCRQYGGNIYFNVHLQHPLANIITTTKKHLKRNANILEVKPNEKGFGRLLAIGYPNSYKKDSQTKAVLSSVNFDIDTAGHFYVTYEADSLIYVYDNSFNMLQCYGFAGRDMDLNYTQANNLKEAKSIYHSERNSKGYYNWLEYVDETGMLFRSYKKGVSALSDGLQIFKNGIMIGDVDVPKGTRVMGYIAPYYYSYIIPNDKLETLTIYRFQL